MKKNLFSLLTALLLCLFCAVSAFAEMPLVMDTYTHTTGDMQKRAAEIVDEFLTDIFGEELKPWQENEKTEKELSA